MRLSDMLLDMIDYGVCVAQQVEDLIASGASNRSVVRLQRMAIKPLSSI